MLFESLYFSSILITWVVLTPHVFSTCFYLIILNLPIGILPGFSSQIFEGSLSLKPSLGRTPRWQATWLVTFAFSHGLNITTKFQGLTFQGCQAIALRTLRGYHMFCLLVALVQCKIWTLCRASVHAAHSGSTTKISLPVSIWSVWLAFSVWQIVVHYYIETYQCIHVHMY